MPEPTPPSCANAFADAAKGADDIPAPHEVNERVSAETSRQSGAPGNGKGLDVDAIMSRVRHEVAKRGATTEGWFDPMGETITGAHWRPVAPRLPPRDQYALSDFLRFNDEDLVDVAYRTLLRRPANDDGSRSYVDALRHGAVSKVEVLGSIRFSDEGRRQSVHVDGLLRPYTLHRWRRIPVVGWFVGMGMALVRLPRLALRLQGMEAAAAHETQALGRWVNHVDAAVAKRMLRTEDDLRALRDEFSELNRAFEAATARLEANEAKLHESNTRRQAEIKESNDRYEAMLHDSAVRHDAALKSLNERVLKDQRSLRGMLDRLTVFLDATMRQHADGAATGPHEQTPSREQQYLSFENAFRGDRGEIKDRVAYYLDPLAKAGIEPAGENVILDLGSGRGEWLEVLAERGYCGRGVDLNREMVKESQARGHEVVEADVLSFLKAQEGDSFAAISSMHLIEHLPHAALIQLLDEAVRVLRPGGVLILETPNPENVRVGSCMFYMDPTHLNPIPPLLLQWLVQTRGFEQATIERLSDHRGKPDLVPVSEDVPGAAQINQMVEWFTVPPDYAVIARKPLP
jgi:O-antigen chain-terminating methyltransferase